MNYTVDVAIAEDYLLFRQGIVSFLSDEPGINIIFEVDNGQELIEKLKFRRPHIILLDVRMPVLDGREALRIIQQNYPEVKVIILSMHYSDAYIAEFLSAGACSFLPKNCPPGKLIDAIFAVYQQGYYYDTHITKIITKLVKTKNTDISAENSTLTARELEIIRLLCDEKSIGEISDKLFISIRTVEWHKKNVFEKTHSRSLAGLALYAVRAGIIPNPEDLFN
ncbi:MAG: response regulator transcription factor [Bacteroidetes bacterium]|jgi:DNA-binding NarL/FixJ family response regulator|nr:response regulator transcription factor [Bacteroidota bacterium]